jgi:hypothetical protein
MALSYLEVKVYILNVIFYLEWSSYIQRLNIVWNLRLEPECVFVSYACSLFYLNLAATRTNPFEDE